MRRLILMVALLTAVAWSAPAAAATWSAPGDATLSGTLAKGSGAWLELPWEIVSQQTVPLVRSVELVDGGNLLVALGALGQVQVLSPAGDVLWQYQAPGLRAWNATMTPDGNVLIVDRRHYSSGLASTVYEVDYASKAVVWRFGGVYHSPESTATPPPNWLQDPFGATRLPNGNTIICDNQGERAIEVRSADYDPARADDGYDASSIVWAWNTPSGVWPRSAQRLGSGVTLLATNRGVAEVDGSGNVIWELGAGILGECDSARRLDDGTTLIAEDRTLISDRGRAVRVSRSGEVLWEYGVTSLLGLDDIGLNAPRGVVLGTNGSVLIADQNNGRVLELGHAAEGSGASAPVDCGLPGVRKRFTTLSADLDIPEGTSATVEYSVDGGPWRTANDATLPDDTFGTLISYRVTLATTSLYESPRLLGVSIGFEPAPESTTGESGTSTGSRSSRLGRSTGGQAAGTGSGSMDAGGGYAIGGAGDAVYADAIPGTLSIQRGWAMARVGPVVLSEAGPGTAGSPAMPLEGLLALAVVYAAGIASTPIQHVIVRMFAHPAVPS